MIGHVAAKLSGADGAPALAPARLSRRVVLDMIALVDGVVIALVMIAVGVSLEIATLGQLSLPRVMQTSVLAGIIAVLYLRGTGQYEYERMLKVTATPVQLVVGIAIGVFAAVGTGIGDAVVRLAMITWSVGTVTAATIAVLGCRLVAQQTLKNLMGRGYFDTRVAVYGAGPIAERAKEYLQTSPTGTWFVGTYDDRADPDRRSGVERSVTGSLSDLIAAGRADRIDQVIIALPASASGRLAGIVKELSQLPISIHVCTHVASDLIDTSIPHHVSSIGPLGLLDVKSRPLSDWGVVLKWLEDRILGCLLFLMFLPIMAVMAIAVKLDSPGPVLFRQRRHGLNRRVIEVLKFRTMTAMEDGNDVRQATRDDPRVTRVGRILRRTSLDELPQLWNVVKGEMSLVGPRPHALVHDDHYGQLIEAYANRQRVKPGITGLAQVEGLRGETDTPEKMRARVERDLAYIDTWSLLLDLRILAKTAVIAITGRNAY